MQRLFRDRTDAVFGREGFGAGGRALRLPWADGRLKIVYRRGRWAELDEYDAGVKSRRTKIRVDWEGEHLGSANLVEYKVEVGTEAEHFLNIMDNHSQNTANVGFLLFEHWSDPTELMWYGPIVELERAWSNPVLSCGDRFGLGLRAVLGGLFAERSLLILKAHPLEYEGKVCEETRDAFGRRQRALMRHYERSLAVRPFSGEDGRSGWMYEIAPRLEGLVPKPVPRPEAQ